MSIGLRRQEIGTVVPVAARSTPQGRRAPGWSAVLDELDEAGIVVELGDEEAEALAATGLVEVRPEAPGLRRLVPCGTVGAVRVGAVQVRVEPKDGVSLPTMLFMLGYADDPGFLPSDVDGLGDDELWPAFAASIAQATERALVAGVLRGYVQTDEALRSVRGRIRFSEQITRRPGQLLPLEVTYDDYTVDIAENQVLRTAVQRMLAVPRLHDDVRRRLAHLDARLDGVTPVPWGGRLPRWSPRRQNVRYQPALRLAEVVISQASAESQAGAGLQVAAFVVSMPEVFEQFVATALDEALPATVGQVVPGVRSTLDEPRLGAAQGDLELGADLLVRAPGGRPLAVLDTRYRPQRPDGRHLAEHHHLLGCCHAFGVDRAWLVYAQGQSPEPVSRTVMGGTVTITSHPLDLGRPPAEILTQVTALARDIARALR